jgi:hypothetical protein
MQYVEFRDQIQKELRRNRGGLTWAELQSRLALPYRRPCSTWLRRLESEIGLLRRRGSGQAFIWKIRSLHSRRDHT